MPCQPSSNAPTLGSTRVQSPSSSSALAQAASFAEDLVVVDLETGEGEIREWSEEVPAVYDALVLGLGDYCAKTGFSQAVIGLSGGIDSSITTALAVDALVNTAPGRRTLADGLHPWIRGQLVVIATPLAALTGAGGEFELGGVPPGQRVIELWHEELGEARFQVEVAAGGVTRVELELGGTDSAPPR